MIFPVQCIGMVKIVLYHQPCLELRILSLLRHMIFPVQCIGMVKIVHRKKQHWKVAMNVYIKAPFHFSVCISHVGMASVMKKLWVRFEEEIPIRVTFDPSADIYDLIQKAKLFKKYYTRQIELKKENNVLDVQSTIVSEMTEDWGTYGRPFVLHQVAGKGICVHPSRIILER